MLHIAILVIYMSHDLGGVQCYKGAARYPCGSPAPGDRHCHGKQEVRHILAWRRGKPCQVPGRCQCPKSAVSGHTGGCGSHVTVM